MRLKRSLLMVAGLCAAGGMTGDGCATGVNSLNLGVGAGAEPRVSATAAASNPLLVTVSVDLSGYPTAQKLNWSFGDGSRVTNLGRSTGSTLTHRYLRPGSFELEVYAFDTGGRLVTFGSMDLTVQTPPSGTDDEFFDSDDPPPDNDDDDMTDGDDDDDTDDDDGDDGDDDDPGAETLVILRTSKGDIILKMLTADAPITVANFLRYVDDGDYNNTVFHRVIDGFVIQGGGFESLGERNSPRLLERQPRSPISSEANNGHSNTRGTVAMALRGQDANSGTNQFFINLDDNTNLDTGPPPFTVFAEVVMGMDVVDEIAGVATDSFTVTTNQGETSFSDVPVEDVTVLNAIRG
jgi:peptidyl-prolyl cis-trans isomerase A (cyclophilin A)/peptidyl-prolyl cis-trans isomerase B (cyclophilin B)